MKQLFSKSTFIDFWNSFYDSYLPTKRDNLKQIITKSAFLLSIVLLVIFFIFFASYFNTLNNEESLYLENKQTFEQLTADNNQNCEKALKHFKKQNSDLKGWISIENTYLSDPIYQTKDNEFYLTHNQLKNKSSAGALFFDCKDSVTSETTDKNFVVYGNSPKSEHLFSVLKHYKSLYFYKQNPYINLSTFEGNQKYVIFATFIINSKRLDDGNYIFDYKRSNFDDENSYFFWKKELEQRSLYSANIPVTSDDYLLTLVTDSVEFEGAKLVVMARKLHEDEVIDFSNAKINKNPRYPDAYYTTLGINNPFNIKEEDYVS